MDLLNSNEDDGFEDDEFEARFDFTGEDRAPIEITMTGPTRLPFVRLEIPEHTVLASRYGSLAD